MKPTSKPTISCVCALVFVASSIICDARPHVQGVFENVRRMVHPSKASFNCTTVPAMANLTFGKSIILSLTSTRRECKHVAQFPDAAIVPVLSSRIRASPADLGEANATAPEPLHLPNVHPTPEPLRLVAQDGHQALRQRAHPMGQRHGSHHQHTKKVSRPAVAKPTVISTYQEVQATRATRVARQIQPVSNIPSDGAYQSWVVKGFSNPPSSSASATSSLPTSLCPERNGTVFRSSSGITYETVCGTNYTDAALHHSVHDSFETCIRECDIYNYNTHGVTCVAAAFATTRSYLQDNCYLYSSITHPTYEGDGLQVAVRFSVAQSAHLPVSGTVTALLSSLPSVSSTIPQSSSSHSQTSNLRLPSASATVSPPGVTYGNGNSVITPKVSTTRLHGPSENRPTTQYIQYDSPDGVNLAKSLLRVGVNGDLSTGYDISPQTGVLEVNIYTQNALAPLRSTPHLSRDGGRGGYLNGQHLFLFCDTGSYSGVTLAQNGDFLDFVSSSVAVDVGMNALSGNPIHLQDGIGEWSDNVGRQRGFAPLTQGEQAYNIAMQGQGQRYAVWIESSIIPLDAETGLIYAPIVYDNVNVVTRVPVFTYTGNTILTITAGGRGGPVAQRPVRKLFDQDEPEWGVAGGLRSWGPSGIGGTDGRVYLFGGVSGGMLMARVAADSIENRDAYQYWNGNSWSTIMPGADSKAFFIHGPIMDIDVFYSPRHMTFIAVYLTIYADSTFYYRYLKADHAIIPSYAPGGDKNLDCAEYLLKYKWSDEQVLYKASPGLGGSFIYSGGVHLRYFGSDDVANGGSRMLLSWTAPTGQNPASATSEYQIVTAEVDFA
ncbi:MAG: hypothetical protein Q9201_004937 [Fulgogasparrea decipioides]